jgi:hypothetical protein
MSMTGWPDTSHDQPPRDHPYRTATWLLGRHPRLARLAARIPGVIGVDPDHERLSIDVDHLGDVFAALPAYGQAWDDYEHHHQPPDYDDAYHSWQEAGPKAEDFTRGLSNLLVMSSGELACLRLLAILGTTRVPFRLADLSSLDHEGQRLLADWCAAIRAA